MRQKISISILALIMCISAFGQKNVYLTVKHQLGDNSFAFNQAASNDMGDNLSVTRIDYYMSNFVIIHDGGQTLNLPESVIILAKGSNNVEEYLGSFNVTNIEGITFSIGVPPSYNHTDPSIYGPQNPLSPQSPAMQWGWAAGYRFVAIEGKAGASLKTDYQMHGLWDANYFSQTKMAAGIASGDDIYINLDADYTLALKGINVTSGPIDHGVNATDLTVLQNFRDYVFSPGLGLLNSNNVKSQSSIAVYPNPSKGEVYIDDSNLNSTLISVGVVDFTGRPLSNYQHHNNVLNSITIPSRGVYFMVMRTNSGETISRKIIIE